MWYYDNLKLRERNLKAGEFCSVTQFLVRAGNVGSISRRSDSRDSISRSENCQRGIQWLYQPYTAIKLHQPCEKMQALRNHGGARKFFFIARKTSFCRRVDNYAIKERYYTQSCPSSGTCMRRNTRVYISRKAEAIYRIIDRVHFFSAA